MSVKQILGNQEIELRELTSLRAIPKRTPQAATEAARAVLSALEATASPVASDTFTHADRETLDRAGWAITLDSEEARTLAASLASSATAPAEKEGHRVFLSPDDKVLIETPRLTIKLNPSLEEQEVATFFAQANLRPLRTLGYARNLFEVEPTDSTARSLDVSRSLQDRPEVEYAEAQIQQPVSPRLRPGDPKFAEQWQWRVIRAEAAWNSTRGAGVRIAIVDLGMDVDHRDLRAGIKAGAGGHFQAERNGGSVFVPIGRDLRGFPDHFHGTFCMGMAGARINGMDGCGAAPEAQLVPVAAMPGHMGSQADLARALSYAIDPSLEDPGASAAAGADLISCSLEAPQASVLGNSLQDAFRFAIEKGRGGKGALIFWAVDDSEVPISGDKICSHPDVVAVGMSSRHDLSVGSAYGPELEFLAPGLNVTNTLANGGFGRETGTSYATPCAAGVAALVLSLHRRLSWREVRDRLRASCTKVGTLPYTVDPFGGRNDRYGYGRIDAARAVGP